MGAIGVFTEEQQAYDLVMNLSWILPTIVVIGALLDALFVTVYMEFAHPWIGREHRELLEGRLCRPDSKQWP